MSLFNYDSIAKAGDLAQLTSPSNKIHFVRLIPGKKIETHRGIIYFDDLIGLLWGSQVTSHSGSPFYLYQPSISDVIREIPRNTQIMYPKDIGFILINMDIGPGTRIIEAGTGSGAFTTALAWAINPDGWVYTYENRQAMQKLALKNLERVKLTDRISFKLKDVAEGFDEQNVDAVFLDLPNPYDYLEQVKRALKPGGFFGSLLPTTNQVSRLLAALHQHDFKSIELCEIILRYYKPVSDRLRPTDRMVAHTGYLIFARPLLPLNGD